MNSWITHPESAWLAGSTLVWLTVAALLGTALILRGELMRVLASWLSRAAREPGAADPDLAWAPPICSPAQLLAICLGAGLAAVLALGLLTPMLVALALAGPATALAVWAALRAMEARYVARLDRELPAAVGRLGAALRTGGSFQRALERVAHDLPAGPLRAEWLFLHDRVAAPGTGGRPRRMAEVAEALARQTPSARHTALLEHLAVALDQTHDVLVQRVEAAAAALHAAEVRRSAATTELAQMRYSGFAIGLAGLTMFAYLAATQSERIARAYGGPLGIPAGVAVALALAAPFVAGVLLSRADDIEY